MSADDGLLLQKCAYVHVVSLIALTMYSYVCSVLTCSTQAWTPQNQEKLDQSRSAGAC